MVASLVTETRADDLAVRRARPLGEDGRLADVRLEGPLSPHAAAPTSRARSPSPTRPRSRKLLAAGRGAAHMVTLAPELARRDGGRTTARRRGRRRRGRPHRRAPTRRLPPSTPVRRVGTHLFDAMRPLHHREPGPVGALLEDERVAVELVADGVHLHPAVLRTGPLRRCARPRSSSSPTPWPAAGGSGRRLPARPDGDRVPDGVARLATRTDRRHRRFHASPWTRAVRFAVRAAGLPLARRGPRGQLPRRPGHGACGDVGGARGGPPGRPRRPRRGPARGPHDARRNLGQPFVAPRVGPETNCFCSRKNTTRPATRR